MGTYSGGGGTPGENIEPGDPVDTGSANVDALNAGVDTSVVDKAEKRPSRLVTM